MTSAHFYLGLAAPARLEFMVIKNAILILYIYQATRACVGGGACSKQKAGRSLFGNSRARKCNWKFLRLWMNRAQRGEICASNPTRLSLHGNDFIGDLGNML
jgi:hypothetical protein